MPLQGRRVSADRPNSNIENRRYATAVAQASAAAACQPRKTPTQAKPTTPFFRPNFVSQGAIVAGKASMSEAKNPAAPSATPSSHFDDFKVSGSGCIK